MLKESFLKFGSWVAVLPLILIPEAVLAISHTGLSKSASSLTAVGAGAGMAADTGGGGLPTLIGRFITVLLGVLGIIFVIMVIYAGILYMTAGGEDDKVKKAKKLLTQSIIGLVIIVSAYSISTFVISQLVGVTTAGGGGF